MTPATIALLTTGGATPDWASQAVDSTRLVTVDAAGAESTVQEGLADAVAVILDGGVGAPLSLARRAHRLAPTAQLVIIAAKDQHPDLNRALLFTPGIGEVWIVEPDALTTELLDKAAEVGVQRRQHADRSSQVAQRVARLEPPQERRRVVADQYLAVLLELLPEPVLALGENDTLLFRNPAAADVLKIGREEPADGVLLRDHLAAADPEALDQLLERGRRDVVRGQLHLGRPPHQRVYDAAVAPVGRDREVRALVLHDVTDQVRAREQLEEQRDQLEQQKEALTHALEHRSRFYASMSHELRTPINAIIGYGELLREDIFGSLPDQQRNALERINRAANHLLELVNDVLDLSKMESGKVVLEPMVVDVRELLADLRATMGPLAEEHDVELKFRTRDACDENFITDSRRLRQILMNLLSNAIRYGEGKPVEVRCEVTPDHLRVEVEDQGPGIPPEKQQDIFEEFVQIGPAEKGGTGLGLPIARTLARALGGELGVESEGSGSTFWVEVPPLEEKAVVGGESAGLEST